MNQDPPIRVLSEPVSLTREGITLSVNRATLTADDLLAFYDGLFSGRLLSPAALDEMTAFYDARDPGTPQVAGHGLGVFRLEADGETLWASLGWFIGSTTLVARSPAGVDTLAITGNRSLFDIFGVWADLRNAASN